MAWAKIDDQMHRKRKIRGLSDAAWRLYVSAIIDCCAEASDGVIEGWALRELLPSHHEDHVRELLGRGLLHDAPGCDSEDCLGSQGLPVADTDCFIIHDFNQWQMSKEEWSARKKREAAAALLANHKRWHERRGVVKEDCPHCSDSDPKSDPIVTPIRNPISSLT